MFASFYAAVIHEIRELIASRFIVLAFLHRLSLAPLNPFVCRSGLGSGHPPPYRHPPCTPTPPLPASRHLSRTCSCALKPSNQHVRTPSLPSQYQHSNTTFNWRPNRRNAHTKRTTHQWLHGYRAPKVAINHQQRCSTHYRVLIERDPWRAHAQYHPQAVHPHRCASTHISELVAFARGAQTPAA